MLKQANCGQKDKEHSNIKPLASFILKWGQYKLNFYCIGHISLFLITYLNKEYNKQTKESAEPKTTYLSQSIIMLFKCYSSASKFTCFTSSKSKRQVIHQSLQVKVTMFYFYFLQQEGSPQQCSRCKTKQSADNIQHSEKKGLFQCSNKTC